MDSFDLIVVGAGPGGYVAAIRAAQLGLRVALVEKEKLLGGTCLRVGCIPTKALLESSELYHAARERMAEHGVAIAPEAVRLDLAALMARKERVVGELAAGLGQLMKKNRVAVHHGLGTLKGEGVVEVAAQAGRSELRGRAVLLATGSAPMAVPGMSFDGRHVVTSTEALAFDRVPEHLIVVGAGAVGLELGSVWRRLGARVTVVEMLPEVAPFADRQIALLLRRALKKQGLDFRLSARVAQAGVASGRVAVVVEDAKGQIEQLDCDRLLVAVGRRPYTDGLGLEAVGLAPGPGGRIGIDQRLATASPGVYAIGDLVAGPMLAHKAEEEGAAVAELVAGKAGRVSYATIPSIVYTSPELGQVGLTEEQAKEQAREYKVGKFFFKANGRARTMGAEDGMVKVLADAQTDRLLGVHILGPHASELVAEAVAAMELGASAADLGRAVHAHPTLSEAVKEAALAVHGRAVHA
ncbi:MAG: dihydrolipoyl dehydrogenase [Deltaproteobacteria bacterium]|nr:dihydrolipoyl dehydrogenase [Deltaproteobacteria bacterium]